MIGTITFAGIFEFFKYAFICGLIFAGCALAFILLAYLVYKFAMFLYHIFVPRKTSTEYNDGYTYCVIWKGKWTYLIARYSQKSSIFKREYEYLKVNKNDICRFDKNYIAYRNVMFLSMESAQKTLNAYLALESKEGVIIDNICK